MTTKLSIEAYAEEAAESIINGNMPRVYDSIVLLSWKEAVAVTAVVSMILGEHDRGLYLRFVDYTVRRA